ncbi:MAG: tetratricopeptide repeat protein, partial [Beijerinckiaceae bacterium]
MQISGSLKSPSQLNSGDNLDIAKRLLQAGSNDAAIAILDKLVSMQPDNLLAREYLFDAYFQSRRWSKAIEVNKRLLELNPNSGKYWQQRLHALNNNKDFD